MVFGEWRGAGEQVFGETQTYFVTLFMVLVNILEFEVLAENLVNEIIDDVFSLGVPRCPLRREQLLQLLRVYFERSTASLCYAVLFFFQ